MNGSTNRMKETALTSASSRNIALASDAQRQTLRADIRQRLATALMRSGDAVTDPKLARLPGPVRYRVRGALAAWDALRTATDRLLDAAYIAEDVPIGMLEMPTDTLCIVPEPTRWKQAGDIEAIAIFKNDRSIGFATWLMAGGPSDGAAMDSITLPLEDPDKTIRELVDELFQQPAADGLPDSPDAQQFWRNALNYAIKMSLYLNARDAQVVRDRAYSSASRHFPGLGKRKRTERLAEIEQLYDRHIVGPAIFDAEAAGSVPSDSAQREVSSHWRRPHFRMQPYGLQAALRKLIFVGPTLVRPDRLGL
ncbi:MULTISPECIES: hypothetical protein [Burkholderia]|uniref:Uncharacterized protein n=1 Tax=Burkholderia mayonis TaxID=1385591 RepID=A0A1B4FHN1_9BURK|nr:MULTISPECIES: hypothetical protein [Burkholderia]AOJ03155.1 hypothetical protein WS70_16060 [Burkholderia mayonis]KVE39074.1 hypothetical protein WS69_01660 [Burkholderia sp. BDU5]KVE48284.1 hypothetical protein WS70_24430 [Burkholderia mayonis]